MRIGNNPLRTQRHEGTPLKYASVVTHLPNLEGYHESRLDVIKGCLISMREGAPDIPVIVWDNGSCDALLDWLVNDYKPYSLVLSPNVGKSNARAGLFGMVDPRAVMALSDDDMLFYPGWFDACLELIETFPSVGKVSCYPVRTQARWGCEYTKQWARERANIQVGRFISDEEDADFCTSIGREYEWHKTYSAADMDHLVTFRGVEAYCFAHHCQFMAKVETIRPFLKRSDDYMADEKPFDATIDLAKLLQLTTRKRYARHIGNFMDAKVAVELAEMGVLV